MCEIAIDTCVFVHLLNPQNNQDAHIDKLLRYLIKENFKLLVDSTGRIGNEYLAQIIPMFKRTYETGTQRYLLQEWMQDHRRIKVDLDAKDRLMTAIRRVIPEVDEHADRAFIYVACKHDSDLITNDTGHILDRRSKILSCTKKCRRGDKTRIVSSIEAYEGIPK